MALGIGEKLILLILSEVFFLNLFTFYYAVSINVAVVVGFFIHLIYEASYFDRIGIPNDKFTIFMANLVGIRGHGMINYDMKFARFGNWGGLTSKDISSTDTEILRKILVKNAVNFEDRASPYIRIHNDKSLLMNIVNLKTGEDWHRIRNLITPAYTTGKIKKLFPIFNDCARECCDYIDTFVEKSELVSLKRTMELLTLSTICKISFSIDVGAFKDGPETIFLKHAKGIFEMGITNNLPSLFCLLFPNISAKIRQLTGHPIIFSKENEFFDKFLNEMLDLRQSEKDASSKYNDLLQILLNSLEEEAQQNDKHTPQRQMNRLEILAQSFIVLVAGYENVSIVLQSVLYLLAKFSKIQKRVRKEIDEVLGSKEDVEYEDALKLNYLNQVILETMRLYPPSARVSRVCTKAMTIKGIEFKEGFTFNAPIYTIHHDEKYYENPYTFDPERFTPEEIAKRDPLTYMPFGFGPRHCLGRRLAELKIKVMLAILVKKFYFYPAPGDESEKLPVKLEKPVTSLFVRVEKV